MIAKQRTPSFLRGRALSLALVLVILALAAAAILMLMASGTSRAAPPAPAAEGDLLLDDGSIPTPTGPALTSNTATSVGTIERQLCNVAVDSTVTIDVVAVDAEDWASFDFVIYYPSPIVVKHPGDLDGGVDQDQEFDDVEVIDGLVDISGNGTIGNEDDGFLGGVILPGTEVIDGGLDTSGNGTVGTEDDLSGFAETDVEVIDGGLDIVGNGTIGTEDDGFIDSFAAFDFAMLDLGDLGNTLGSQNLLFPDSTDANADYGTTDIVPDGSSPHGVSLFDNSSAGNSGSGGLARLKLDTTNLPAGEYTLLLGKTAAFGGGVHSDPFLPAILPDNFGALTLAIGQGCSPDTDGDGVSDADENTFGSDPNDIDSIPESNLWLPEYGNPTVDPADPRNDVPPCTDGIDNDGDGLVDFADDSCLGALLATPTPTATSVPTATATPKPTVAATPTATVAPVELPTTGGSAPADGGNSWLILIYVAGGVIAAMAAAGAVSQRLRRRGAKSK